MPNILCGKLFPAEYMAEVGSTPGAENFRAAVAGIGKPPNRSRNFVVEGRPAAAGVKFVIGPVERRAAIAARVNSALKRIGIAAGERTLRAVVQDHLLFFDRQGTIGGLDVFHCNYSSSKERQQDQTA